MLSSGWMTLTEKKRDAVAVVSTDDMREEPVKEKVQEMRRGELKLFAESLASKGPTIVYCKRFAGLWAKAVQEL